MAKRRVKAVDPWKLKKWYTILAPKVWGEKEIGETAADEPEKLIGRTVTLPATDLTGSIGHVQYLLKFQIVDVAGGTAKTEFVGYELDNAFIKRLTRRHTSKIETVFDAKSRDGKTLHIKVFVWTAVRASNAQAKAIRKLVMQEISDFVSKRDAADAMKEFVVGDFMKGIAEKVKKILPVRRAEVAKVRVVEKLVATEASAA